MKRDPYVDRWMEGKPAEAILRRVRDIVMWADPRIGEYLKYGTVQFGYNGDFANFVQHDKKTVSLMFNRGARIKGSFPHLEGTGPSARFVYGEKRLECPLCVFPPNPSNRQSFGPARSAIPQLDWQSVARTVGALFSCSYR